jgi:hypothetical protein
MPGCPHFVATNRLCATHAYRARKVGLFDAFAGDIADVRALTTALDDAWATRAVDPRGNRTWKETPRD